MLEKNRKISDVNYALNVIPLDYRCDHCHAHGVKLWREYQTIAVATKLLCEHCAKIDQKETLAEFGEKCFPERGDQIGNLLPAVPVEGDDTYWGYTSVPYDGVIWWKNLPVVTPYDYPIFDLAEFETAINLSAFGIDLKPILKAVSVAKELGMKFIPKAWIVYIQSGWRIANHLDNYVWLRPLRSGSISVEGLVKEINLDIKRLLDTKMDLGTDIGKVLRSHFPSKNDVGKIFYLQQELTINEKNGKIVTRENFLKIDPSEIRAWVEVGEFDVVDID